MCINSPFEGLRWFRYLDICLSPTSIHSYRSTVFQLQEGLRTGVYLCTCVCVLCGYFLWTQKIDEYLCLPEWNQIQGTNIGYTCLFHGTSNLYQHSYIYVNNVSDVIAIKQFLCCATDLNHKSLLNEVLSAFFFPGCSYYYLLFLAMKWQKSWDFLNYGEHLYFIGS